MSRGDCENFLNHSLEIWDSDVLRILVDEVSVISFCGSFGSVFFNSGAAKTLVCVARRSDVGGSFTLGKFDFSEGGGKIPINL